jgi:uncharacterized protein (TIGR03437 family)
VVGVNNNGQVASYLFTVAPSAPGIFTDSNLALVPTSIGRRGDTLTLFVTGEGDVSPPLATGASPFSATPVNRRDETHQAKVVKSIRFSGSQNLRFKLQSFPS